MGEKDRERGYMSFCLSNTKEVLAKMGEMVLSFNSPLCMSTNACCVGGSFFTVASKKIYFLSKSLLLITLLFLFGIF